MTVERRDDSRLTTTTLCAVVIVLVAAALTAAPASPLHEAMLRVQSAAAGSDHAAFTSALGEAKHLASAAPAGEERDGAQRALHVYDDLARLWRYSEESRTGAFFEAGELLAMLHTYPGYDKAVAGETVVAGDRTLYPTAESRAFLAREAARRFTTRPEAAAPPAPAPAAVEHKTRPPVLRKKPEEVAKKQEEVAKKPEPKPASPAVAQAPSVAVPPVAVPQPTTTALATVPKTIAPPTVSTATLPAPTAPAPTAPSTTASPTTVPATTAIASTATVATTSPSDTTATTTTTSETAVTSSSTTLQPETATAPQAAGNTPASTDTAPTVQPLSVGGMARTAIAIALIVAAAASLIYLLRSSD